VRPLLPVPPQFHRGQHLREARDRRRPPSGGGAQGRVHSRGASVAVTVNKTACPKWPTRRRHGRAWYDKGSTAGPRPTFPSLLPVFQTHAGNAGRSGACSRGPDLERDAARDLRHRAEARRAFEAVCTASREVEFLDRRKSNGGEGARHARLRQSRTRVWGLKMIRYRRSPLP